MPSAAVILIRRQSYLEQRASQLQYSTTVVLLVPYLPANCMHRWLASLLLLLLFSTTVSSFSPLLVLSIPSAPLKRQRSVTRSVTTKMNAAFQCSPLLASSPKNYILTNLSVTLISHAHLHYPFRATPPVCTCKKAAEDIPSLKGTPLAPTRPSRAKSSSTRAWLAIPKP